MRKTYNPGIPIEDFGVQIVGAGFDRLYGHLFSNFIVTHGWLVGFGFSLDTKVAQVPP